MVTMTKTIHIDDTLFSKFRKEAQKRTEESGEFVSIRTVVEEKLNE